MAWGGHDAGDLRIGGNSFFGSGRYFNGSITNVQVYNYALSANQINQIYNSYLSGGQSPDITYDQKTYYLSSSIGDDINDGLSPATPWRSLEKIFVEQSIPGRIAPGDSILLKRVDIWEGQIVIQSLGDNDAQPTILGTYGTGEKPIIYGDGRGLVWNPVSGQPCAAYEANIGQGGKISMLAEDNTIYTEIYGWSPSNLTPGYWKTSQYALGNSDIITLCTLDGSQPNNIRTFRSEIVGIISSRNIIAENLDLRETYAGLFARYSDSIIARGIDTLNTQDTALYFAYGTNNSLMENNHLVVSGNTALYFAYSGYNNIMRNNTIDTTYYVPTNISGIIRGGGSDGAGIGLHTGSGDILEYNNINKTGSGAFDFWYENNSIIR
ncbi:MAG TPA: hypothetical protein VI775_02710, partial [Candidatus Paceibacterota bacterium]